MSIEDDIVLLAQVPFLGLLGREALRILAIGSETDTVQRGNVLFATGDKASGAYVVESGSFNLVSPRGFGSIARRGALLGEFSLLIEAPRPYTATARELSSVMRIPRPLFLKMLDGYPDVAARLRDAILQQCEETADDIERARASLGSAGHSGAASAE